MHHRADLLREIERARPQQLVAQRDSDANKDIEASRDSAMSELSCLSLRVGSNLEKQFHTSYIPRVFNMTCPWCVGGPDFAKHPRPRRQYDDSPFLSLHAWTVLMVACCEYQFRADWDFNPGVFSLSFATKVNQGVSMSINRALRRGQHDELSDRDIGAAAARIYNLLWEGEYIDAAGRRSRIHGALTKFPQVIGLKATEKALLLNYHFMSSRIPGTRQIRGAIRHIIFSSRVFYGIPVFMSFTPSERHSGLVVRLYRGRRHDPAYAGMARDLAAWAGYDSPSLRPPERSEDDDEESVEGELPEYDTRRILAGRDPLSCVYAFMVITRVVFPALYGFRMCPDCPHCATAEHPCMDSFGSSATPMGGCAGRADGMIAAVEAQQGEGALLHVHLFLYLHCLLYTSDAADE